MKALLLKDYYMIRKYCRVQLIITLVFILSYALGGADNMSIFFLVYPVITASLIPYTMLAYEEKDKWDVYARSLPFSVRDLVAEKYLLGLIMIAAVCALLTAGCPLFGLLPGNTPYSTASHLYRTLKLLPAVTAVGLAYQSLMMPAIFRFGVEKGRYIYLGLMALLFAVIVALQEDLAQTILLHSSGVKLWAIFPVFLVLYGLSFLISCHIYAKREL